jgi:glycosyltransferase involved in cell wall biosynthesis
MGKELMSAASRTGPALSASLSGGVVMIGTSLDTQGGIASVIRVYLQHADMLGAAVQHVPTHCDGSKWEKGRRALVAWLTYMGLLVRRRVQLLHVHCASGPSFWRKCFFMLPTFAIGLPVVLHWHGGGFVAFYQRSPRWQQRVIAWVFARSDRVVALSAQWQTTLATMFPRARLVTIPNPVQLPQPEAYHAVLPPIVLFLGRIVAEKGVGDLLKAMRPVLARFPECRLVMAGTGDLQRYREMAVQLGVEHAVQFPGYVEGAEKVELLRRACLFVLPSHIEAMPMSVLEAMAYDLPVVATTVGGIPQAVRHGVDGVLFEPRDVVALADALVRLLSDEALRRSMSASARLRVEQCFAADLIVPRVQALWSAVLDERNAASGR